MFLGLVFVGMGGRRLILLELLSKLPSPDFQPLWWRSRFPVG